MARIDLSTIGMRLGYAMETEAGVKPATFNWLKGAKSLPEMNSEPETIESTTFDELQFKTYIDGLQDTGGALAIGMNQTEELINTWNDLYDTYAASKDEGKSTWWVFWHPSLTKAFFFRGNPSKLGWGGAEVNSLFETNVYVTPVGDIGWADAIEPTEVTAGA
jgi:hypothetical protein